MLQPTVTNCKTCPLTAEGAQGRCPFVPVQLPAGAVLCGQGELHTTAYFIRDGTVALSSVSTDGSESTLSLRGPRALLCLEALQHKPSPFEVRTISPARLCALPGDDFLRWATPEGSSSRAVLLVMLSEISERYRDMAWKGGDVSTRVARFILAWSEQSVAARPPKKQLVARLLGIRPETFSRCLKQLVEQGLVDRGSGLRVRDPIGLAAVARRVAA